MTANQFKKALERLGLKQGQAAKAMGLSISMVSKYANGHWPIPPLVEHWVEAEIKKAEKA